MRHNDKTDGTPHRYENSHAISIECGTQQQTRRTALSCNCGQCHVDSRRTRLSANLFSILKNFFRTQFQFTPATLRNKTVCRAECIVRISSCCISECVYFTWYAGVPSLQVGHEVPLTRMKARVNAPATLYWLQRVL